MSGIDIPLRAGADHVIVAVRATTRASRERLGGIYLDDRGQAWLQVHVHQAPEGGRANDAITVLMAKKLGVARSSVTIIAGSQRRQKQVRIDGDPAMLAGRLEELLEKI